MNQLPSDSPFSPLDPTQIVLESEHGVAFYDRFPLTRGHTLVIPWQKVDSLYSLAPEIQAGLWGLAGQVRAILLRQFRPAGFNIGLNDGLTAGQTVSHVHIHIIPRYQGDVPDPRGGIRWIIPEKARYW